MATGTGKTATATHIVRDRVKHGRILWLAHRRELLDQAAATITARMGLETEREQGDHRASWCGGLLNVPVVVGSVQTFHPARLARWPRNSFDTIVVDECHHATARAYRDVLEHFGGAKVLGLTATPDRADGVALGSVFDSVAYVYDIKQAIDEGFLVPIRQHTIQVADLDLGGVRVVNGDLSAKQVAERMRSEAVLHQVIAPTVRLVGERPTIVFTASVAQAEAMAEIARRYGIRAEAVSGKTPDHIRARILADYQSGAITMVTNCNVLTEGFDAPHTEVIAMARPTKSRALYAQCVGRGTRLSPGKNHCLVIDFAGNAGKHRLVCPADILAGKEVSEDTERRVRELSDEGMDVDAALDAATAEEAAEAVRAAEVGIVADVHFDLGDAVNPWTAEPVTQKQRDKLVRLGVPLHEVPERAGEAGALLGEITKRLKRGGPTFKQARTLEKFGLRADMSKTEASFVIDCLAGDNWMPSRALKKAYGRE